MNLKLGTILGFRFRKSLDFRSQVSGSGIRESDVEIKVDLGMQILHYNLEQCSGSVTQRLSSVAAVELKVGFDHTIPGLTLHVRVIKRNCESNKKE